MAGNPVLLCSEGGQQVNNLGGEIGEAWDGRHYDPEFFYQLSKYAKEQGDNGRAERYQAIAKRWDLAWSLVELFSYLTGQGYSMERVVQPPIHQNRKARRMLKSVGRSATRSKKMAKALGV